MEGGKKHSLNAWSKELMWFPDYWKTSEPAATKVTHLPQWNSAPEAQKYNLLWAILPLGDLWCGSRLLITSRVPTPPMLPPILLLLPHTHKLLFPPLPPLSSPTYPLPGSRREDGDGKVRENIFMEFSSTSSSGYLSVAWCKFKHF